MIFQGSCLILFYPRTYNRLYDQRLFNKHHFSTSRVFLSDLIVGGGAKGYNFFQYNMPSSSSDKRYYDVLDIPPDSSEETIRVAYKKLVSYPALLQLRPTLIMPRPRLYDGTQTEIKMTKLLLKRSSLRLTKPIPPCWNLFNLTQLGKDAATATKTHPQRPIVTSHQLTMNPTRPTPSLRRHHSQRAQGGAHPHQCHPRLHLQRRRTSVRV